METYPEATLLNRRCCLASQRYFEELDSPARSESNASTEPRYDLTIWNGLPDVFEYENGPADHLLDGGDWRREHSMSFSEVTPPRYDGIFLLSYFRT